MFSLKGLIFSFKASVNAYIFYIFFTFYNVCLFACLNQQSGKKCLHDIHTWELPPIGLLNANAVGWVYVKKNFPHAYKDSTISEAVGQKNFSLKKDEWCKIYLDKNHAYYYQIQAQIFIFAVEHCDFVMWSTKDLLCKKFFLTESFEKMQSVLPLSSSASAFCLKL